MKKGLVYEKSNVKGLGSLYYYFGHSANSEKIGERGLSHFAEHLMCHSFDHLLPKLRSLGITYNAQTHDDFVIFYWTGLDEKIHEVEPELLNLFSYIPSKDQFENERKIILQEYDDYFSGQNSVYINADRKYLNFFGAIGFRKDIEDVTYEQMLVFIERFRNPTKIYRVSSMKKNVVSEIYKNVEYKLPLKNSKLKPQPIELESSSSFPTSTLVADWVNVSGKMSNVEATFLSNMYASGLESPMYNEIREKRGLAYAVSLFVEEYKFMDYNKINTYILCNEEKVSEVRELVNNILSNPEEFLTKERFDVVKSCDECGRKIQKINNHSNVLKNLKHDLAKLEAEIDALTFERIMECANILKNEVINFNYASYGKEMVV